MNRDERFRLVVDTWLARQGLELKDSMAGEARVLTVRIEKTSSGTLHFAAFVSKCEVEGLVKNLLDAIRLEGDEQLQVGRSG